MSYSKAYCEPIYLISEVAKILNIHPQTLRQYEREGLVTPSRTNGKIRLYSQENIDFIKNILHLTRELGINLAGVSKILDLETKINSLEVEISEYKTILNPPVNNKALVVKKEKYDLVIIDHSN